MDCGMKTVKILLFIFNFIFSLVGLALIIGGALASTKFHEYVDMLGSTFERLPIAVIILGVIIFIIATFGCCGAFKENHCMVTTFSVLLGAILIAQIAAGISAFVMKEKVKGVVDEGFNNMIKQHVNDTSGKGIVVRHIQQRFECCGAKSYKDWEKSVPESCCKVPQCDTKDTSAINQQGCVSKFTAWVQAQIALVAGIAIAVCFIQIIGIIFACCLAKAIKTDYKAV